jgi:3-hydroxyisobutyrate dehydrogenase
MTDTAVAFIGLGELGGALAGSLLRAGFKVRVYDRNPEAVARLVAQGAAPAASVAEAAAGAPALFTCLPAPAVSEAVLRAALPVLGAGADWIELSTLGREDVLRLADLAAAHGVGMLESPVTGGVHLAARGEITVLVGGDADRLARHRPALQAMGGRIFHMGPLGAAASIKVITNMLAFIHLLSCGEALMLAARSGLDLRQSWEAIAASSGSSFVHETEGQLILNGSYDVGFSMDLALKDLGFALAMGRATDTPLDLAALTHQTFVKGRAAYGGAAQSTQIVKLTEDLLGTPLRAEGFPARLT